MVAWTALFNPVIFVISHPTFYRRVVSFQALSFFRATKLNAFNWLNRNEKRCWVCFKLFNGSIEPQMFLPMCNSSDSMDVRGRSYGLSPKSPLGSSAMSTQFALPKWRFLYCLTSSHILYFLLPMLRPGAFSTLSLRSCGKTRPLFHFWISRKFTDDACTGSPVISGVITESGEGVTQLLSPKLYQLVYDLSNAPRRSWIIKPLPDTPYWLLFIRTPRTVGKVLRVFK